MEQFYQDMLTEYNRLKEVYSQARDKVDRQEIYTQLLEEVDEALNDATVLSTNIERKNSKFELEKSHVSKEFLILRENTITLCGLLKNVKEEIDTVLKQHQVMQQLQKADKNVENKYNDYVEQMENILLAFSKETNAGVQSTVEALKKELEKSFQAKLTDFDATVVQPMNKQIHSDLDEHISKATESIKEDFTNTLGNEKEDILKKFKEDYNTKLDSFEKESLNPLEQRTLTNVLTIFGVFASFITIVMVLVGTASSWLNASDISGAIIAFVVPSGIGVLIVCALTALVRVIARDRVEAEKFNIGSVLLKWAPWLIVSGVCAVAIAISICHGYAVEKDRITQEAAKEPTHKIYVYNLSDCLREEGGVTKADGTKEIKQFVEISYFKNKSDEYVTERKEYDEYESFIHDGKLFYCVIHESFE